MERSLRPGAYLRALLAASPLIPGIALSADNGFYLGAASSEVSSDYDASVGSFSAGPEDEDNGFKAMVGFRPLDAFAIEANYADLGETRVPLSLMCITPPCPTEASVDSQALSVSAVGLFALPLVDLFARVGVTRWESELQVLSSAQKEEGTDPTYGAGAQVRLGSFALRLEYERFDLDDDSVDLVSLGFTYTFL
ncbi:MAG TPA: outer membrane beta-barrel protein [Vicinamibacterales bacterium]|nr:outer membrane beta-barrel protein [Vicinamibacterales bacterium]